MSYDDYAKRHEEQSREFVAATFTAISDYERVIADPTTNAQERQFAREALARAVRAMGTDQYPLDGALDVNRDAGAVALINSLAAPCSGTLTAPADPCHNHVLPQLDKAGYTDAPSLSEAALENIIVDLYDGREI